MPTTERPRGGPGATTPGPSLPRWGRPAFGAVLALLVVAAMAVQGGPVFDDPYILFRYAENLATGQGWTFNPGHSTENAVTSVLYVLVVAAARFVGVGVPTAAGALYLLTAWGGAVLAGLTLERLGHRTAGALAAVLLATSPALTSFWGMESSLYLCLVAAALYTAVSQRPPWLTGLLLALVVLARPDGVVVGVLLVVVVFVLDRERRLAAGGWVRLVVGGAVPLAIYAVVAAVAFGTPLPSTLEAKTAQAQSGYWPGYLSSGIATVRGLYAGAPALALGLFWLTVGLAVVGLVAAVVRRAAWQVVAVLVGATALLAALYGLVLNIPNYWWYYALPVFTMSVLAGLGVEQLVAWLPGRAGLRTAVAVGAAGVLAGVGVATVPRGPAPYRADYEVVGDWLRSNTDPDATVAAAEIGTIGWYSDREMVDYLGLLDSSANDHVRDADFLWWPSHYQPDYWVTQGVFVDEPFAASPCLPAAFEVAHRTELHTIYRRVREVRSPDAC